VRLASGISEPISHLKPGDTVLASGPQTGTTKPEKIIRLITTHTDEDFTDLTVSSSPNQPHAPPPSTLTTTWHHPFWDATHHRWTAAHTLPPGTTLRQPNGTTATVLAIRNYHRHETTYDLAVADLHTFYVAAGAASVLVHNCGAGGPEFGQRARAVPIKVLRDSVPVKSDSRLKRKRRRTTLSHSGMGFQYGRWTVRSTERR